MSITVRILRSDGEVINEADFASSDQDCICVDRRGLFRFGPLPSDATTSPASRIAMLEARTGCLESQIGAMQRRDASGMPALRDMGATLVDKAQARWLDAKAAKLEAETREEHGAPPDDGRNPVHVEGWKAGGKFDLGTVNATLFDREERGYELTLLPAQARELAEALLSGARFAETGRER